MQYKRSQNEKKKRVTAKLFCMSGPQWGNVRTGSVKYWTETRRKMEKYAEQLWWRKTYIWSELMKTKNIWSELVNNVARVSYQNLAPEQVMIDAHVQHPTYPHIRRRSTSKERGCAYNIHEDENCTMRWYTREEGYPTKSWIRNEAPLGLASRTIKRFVENAS